MRLFALCSGDDVGELNLPIILCSADSEGALFATIATAENKLNFVGCVKGFIWV